MGKNIQRDGRGSCLIGLVLAAVLAGVSQPSWAQDAADGTPQAAQEEEQASGAQEAEETAGEQGAEEAAGPQETSAAGESAAPENEQAAPAPADPAPADGETATDPGEIADNALQPVAQAAPADATAADPDENDSSETDTPPQPSDEDAADGVSALDNPMSESDPSADVSAPGDVSADDASAADDASEEPASAAGTEEDSADIPANSTSEATPARMREPITGASDPFQFDAEAIDEEPDVETRDPLEGMNRAFFKFNDFLDKLLLKPVAQLYRFIFPDYVEDRIRNVVNNADSPIILANDILQWKWKRAGDTFSRFFINTTLGVGGIWDVAASFGIDRHTEDFGQTLCVWGAGEWFYLYLPFVGPTSPRDMAGKVVDRYFDPLTYYGDVIRQVNLSGGIQVKFNVDRAGMAKLALSGADLIDMRARNIETINEIERTSIDFYTAVRSLYRQSRESACNDGQVDFEELPDLSEEFE